MTWIFLIISLGFAGLGVWLIADFFMWLLSGRVVTATIKGFEGKKDKGFKLPTVLFEDKDGKEYKAQAQRIDQFLFLFNQPREDGFTTVVYKTEKPEEARVYGYINIVAGIALCVPLFAVLVFQAGNDKAIAQFAYAIMFGLIVIGGWAVLKLIQRYY